MTGLDDFGVEEEVVGHDDGTEDAHDDDDGVGWEGGVDEGDCGGGPIDLDEIEFVDEGEPDDGDESDDDAFDAFVGVGE